MQFTIIIETWFYLPSNSLQKLRLNLMNYHFNESLSILPDSLKEADAPLPTHRTPPSWCS